MAKPRETAPKAGPGRPSKYSESIADEICRDLAQGITLSEICRREHMPDRTTVYDWQHADEDFSQRVARARNIGYDAIADECLDIADDGTQDTIEGKFGPMPDKEWILRSKLRVDTRLQLLKKWDPKRYGDKVDVTTSGDKLPASIPLVLSDGRTYDDLKNELTPE